MTKTHHLYCLRMLDGIFLKFLAIMEEDKDWQHYIDIVRKEEKQHRSSTAVYQVPDGMKLGQAVQCMVVCDIMQMIAGVKKAPDAKDFFWVRHSFFGGWAFYQKYREALTAQFPADRAIQILAQLDYAELNQKPE